MRRKVVQYGRNGLLMFAVIAFANSSTSAQENQVYIEQIGDANAAMLDQTGAANNAQISQTGNGLSFGASQVGARNQLTVLQLDDAAGSATDSGSVNAVQEGDDNQADISQEGRSEVTLAQIGNTNLVASVQKGSGHSTSINQEGDTNAVDLTQDGLTHSFTSTQTGNESTITASQTGSLHSAILDQTGSSNTITLTQAD